MRFFSPRSHVCEISFVASLDSTAQTGQSNGGDWQEEVYQKVIYYFLIIIFFLLIGFVGSLASTRDKTF